MLGEFYLIQILLTNYPLIYIYSEKIKTAPTKQERRKADFYGEAHGTERRRNNYEHQRGYTGGLNDDRREPDREEDYWGNYGRKHNWNYNRQEEAVYSEDHWGSSVCERENEWTPHGHREGEGLRKSVNGPKWGIRSTKHKWILILLFIVILIAVGIVLRLRLFR